MNRSLLSKSKGLFLASVLGAAGAARAQDTDADFFEKKIRPVFTNRCAGCHNGKQKIAGLDLSSAAGISAVIQSGNVIQKENPEQSRLLRAIGYQEKIRMPPTGKLPASVIADFRVWVSAGARLPELQAKTVSAGVAPA